MDKSEYDKLVNYILKSGYGKEFIRFTLHGGWRTELLNKLINMKKQEKANDI